MSRPLWSPGSERILASNLKRYTDFLSDSRRLTFPDYAALYDWSVSDLPAFWSSIWDFVQIKASVAYSSVIDNPRKMPGANWFSGARLNFAENILRRRDDAPAVIAHGEFGRTGVLSFSELYTLAAQTASSLRRMGIKPGDRVAAWMPNIPETVAVMLGAVSVGAVFSSCSPDFGTQGVLDRFGQIQPRVLFAADTYSFKGKPIDCLERLARIASDILSLEKVVVVPQHTGSAGGPDISKVRNAGLFADFLDKGARSIDFEQLPFDHPVYVMYSSGTTGLPKCMVQGSGVLLNHLKELVLHTDLKKGERIFYYTTCGWMMWNWLVSALAVGATIVLFDGNPFYPDGSRLWRMAQEEKVNVFGTSARYIQALEEAAAHPGRDFDLRALRTVLSTGSPLSPEGFEYVMREIKNDVQLSSISGGTDLNGCFALGNPILPVHKGELQCRGLGMKVEIFGQDGKPVIGGQGELVCTAPFPSMPLFFWDDADGSKYHKAYFDVYPGVWRHGDFAELTAHGGLIVYGRSDATLNPGGVRLGTSDYYRLMSADPDIADSVVIGQEWKNDVRVVLFVKMKENRMLTEDIKKRIRTTIRERLSPRHVPDKIVAVPDIPYTINMKKVELAVRNIVHNRPVPNREALINSECLEYYRSLPELDVD